MKDQYEIKGKTGHLNLEVAQEVIELLDRMSAYTKLTVSEMANAALKRYIASHVDFLPPKERKGL